MPVWTASPEQFRHVRTVMMCAVYFGARPAKLELRSGQFLVGTIVSTNFGTDLPEKEAELCGDAASGRMFGELHILPEVGPVILVQAIDIESIEPINHARAGARSSKSTET
jgi:hypothetical protein